MSEKVSHTPGPWIVESIDERSKRELHIDSPVAFWICESLEPGGEVVALVEDRQLPRGEANARLIAAAPELLEAARDAQCDCSTSARESGHNIGCWFPALQAAIEKAEGRDTAVTR